MKLRHKGKQAPPTVWINPKAKSRRYLGAYRYGRKRKSGPRDRSLVLISTKVPGKPFKRHRFSCESIFAALRLGWTQVPNR